MMKKYSVWLGIISIIMLVSCSSANLLDGTAYDNDEIKEASDIQQNEYVDLTVNLPDMGRGWDVAKYTVTATRSGETDVTQETTNTSLTMRLKVGAWTFTASAYDSSNNLIYQSASVTHSVSEVNTSINLILDQQSAAMKVSIASNNDFHPFIINSSHILKIKMLFFSLIVGYI